MHYEWQAGLIALAIVIGVSVLGKFLVLRVPALQRMRDYNQAEDEKKLAQAKYPPVVKINVRIALLMNVVLFLVLIPLTTLVSAQPLWRVLLQIAAVLLVYDFLYYMTHRFLFHGRGYFRQVHALHHQARKPTAIDGSYVHPVETFIGIGLFMLSFLAIYPLLGPHHVATAAVTYLAFLHFNSVAHMHIDLPYFPFRGLTWFTRKHAVHHENMHKGNYSTVTLLFDRLFGTLE